MYMSGYSVFITQDLLQTCTLHGHLVARRLRLSLLDRSIAPEFRATQISAGPTMARSIWKRENRKTATDTYSCRPRRALLCLALYWITAAKLRPSPAYRQDDTMPFRRPSNALESLVPGSNDPACRARSLFVSAGNARGRTRLFALIWQQPGQTLRAVDTAFFQLAGWRPGQGLNEKDSKCK